MDGWSVSEWSGGARMEKRLCEGSDRFRRIKIVRRKMLDMLGSRITIQERNEGESNIEKVYHATQSTMFGTDVVKCTICLLNISYQGVVSECGHMFHYICQRRWESISQKCAICRQQIDDNGKKWGVQGLWLKLIVKLTIKERIEVAEPLRKTLESK